MKKHYLVYVCCDTCNDHFKIHSGSPKVGVFVKTVCKECKTLKAVWIYKVEEKSL